MKNSVNCLRVLSMDEINKAKSGHPGVVLGMAPVAYILWHDFLKITPKSPNWFDRDRFVLASGHASSMLYALLHLTGYEVSMNDLKEFRQLGSLTPGHPEYHHTPGLDSTSGPLGQGIPMAAGMAIAEAFLEKRFNHDDIKIIDHYTYVECGDGDLQEGVTLEALSLIGHLKLNKLIILFDSNRVQLDGPVSNAGGISHPKEYFESLGFYYQLVKNPENLVSVNKAISKAKASSLPSIIEFHTIIGYGSPLQGLNKCHGNPLGEEMTEQLKDKLNYHQKPFKVSKAVYHDYRQALEKNEPILQEWEENLKKYAEEYPLDYQELKKVLDDDYHLPLQAFANFEYVSEASRKTMGKALNIASEYDKTLFAGSADLTASTFVKGVDGDFTFENHLGRNINYGVREHAMGAISNGLNLSHVRSMTGAFFVFSDYMKASIRMSALMKLPSIFVFTHDSVAVGEDGPTHEPIEQLAGLRSIPNVLLYRPADSRETVQTLKKALLTKDVPSIIVLSRQTLPLLDPIPEDVFDKGGFSRIKNPKALVTLVGSGSEVSLALETAKLLEEEGIIVNVSEIVSTNLFDQQTDSYKNMVIPTNIPSLFIEMASPYGLKNYCSFTYAINRFGVSAKGEEAIEYLGFTKEKVAEFVKNLLKK